ncbi:MAG: ATP-binding protein [Bacteroidales bacterium]|nr:ATP-binding protein [Bacteroidales bacterium]
MYERKLLRTITEHLHNKEIIVITGPRQTGKTTLLEQLHGFLSKTKEQSYLFTLEDPSFLKALNENPENIFRFMHQGDRKIFLLLDEIQYLKNPSNFLKLMYDKYNKQLKLIVTGSSALYIDSRFKDSLAGRKRVFNLFTLDFEEFLVFRGHEHIMPELIEIRKRDEYISPMLQIIQSLFDEYLTYGGYPAVVKATDLSEKKAILKEIYTSYLRRDILEAGVQHQDKFYNMMLLLAHQSGSQLNINEMANTVKLSVTAIENYIYVLRKCFHISIVRPFYSNVRKELTKMPKVFFNDTGFRNVIMNQFSAIHERVDRGIIAENYLFIRLRQLYGDDYIRYWRTADGNEIDFIIPETQKSGSAIEVKYSHAEFRLSKYRKFTNLYPGFVLNCRAYNAETNSGRILAL